LTVAENRLLGRLPRQPDGIRIDLKTACARSRQVLDELGLDLDPKLKIGRLSIAQQQLVEIARGMRRISPCCPLTSNVQGGWTTLDVAEASGGSLLASTTEGDSVSIEFNGTSIAIIGGGHCSRTGTYDWKIDDGSQHSGTIDQSLDGTWEFSYRWPDVVVNGLAPGRHTLTISVGGEGQYGGTGVYIDAFDYIASSGQVVNRVNGAWDLYD